ncbi:hypothetical protein ACFVGN_38230 [Streptomyces sp. NPDC057757]|uniref:hypothetical protein n=1 Tax=Streptomyces sp. NPDC057757 TaxID=3346241 RepID=UPI0036A584CF
MGKTRWRHGSPSIRRAESSPSGASSPPRAGPAATAYTAALIDQLTVVAGREPTTDGSPSVRAGERRLLLREAAERVTREGGTLLLVVDGLDEDQSLAPGGTGTSIASLLPERPPPGVRAEALTPDGWYHAAHVLGVIDPDALLPMRDVVFAYLGLDDRAATDA